MIPQRGLSAPATVGVAFGVMLVAFAGLLAWDDWFLNPDGAFYLAIADSLRSFEGVRFPDGSVASFRGPGYSLFLAVGLWLGPETTQMAVWWSRSVLVANAGLVAWICAGRGWPSALTAGLLAAVGPLFLASGGLFLVPDSLAVTWVLLAVLLATRSRWAWAGAALGGALVTKETAVLAVAAVVVAGWLTDRPGRRDRTSRLLFGAAALPVVWALYLLIVGSPDLAIGLIAACLVIAGALVRWGPLPDSAPGGAGWRIAAWLGLVVLAVASLLIVVSSLEGWREAPELILRELRQQLTGDGPLWPAGVALAVAVTVGVTGRQLDRLLFGSLLAVGAGSLIHAAVAGLGLRNGVLAGYAVAGLLGLAVAERPRRRIIALATAGGLLYVNMLGAAFVNDRLDEGALTWDDNSVTATAGFLVENVEVALATPTYAAQLARLARPADVRLVPTGVVQTRIDDAVPRAEGALDWAGTRPREMAEADGVGVLRRQTVTVSLADLSEELVVSGATHIVVTGNTAASAGVVDGGLWLALLDGQPWLEKVYATPLTELPHWLVVYRVVGAPVSDSDALIVYSVGEVESDVYPAGTTFLSLVELQDLVVEIVGSE